MKKTKLHWYILLVIYLLIFGIYIKNYSNYSYDRIRHTKSYLARAHSQINRFREINDRYPDSLAELQRYAKEHPEFDHKLFREYLSRSENDTKEFDVLNGEGGWYYNPKTGEIKVNLTKPVKYYMRFYFGKERNEIPSKW